MGAAAVQAACWQRTRLRRLLAGARAERTANIISIVVTLDVSKLSGWLNAIAYCRVEREAWEEGREAGREAGERGGGRRRRKQGAGRGPDCGGCWRGHARSAPET